MPYFKDDQNEVFYLETDDVQRFKKPHWQQITTAEADTIREQKSTPDHAAQIRARLAEIDAMSVRALRATLAAQGKGRPVPAYDLDKLDSLEVEAAALRQELAAL